MAEAVERPPVAIGALLLAALLVAELLVWFAPSAFEPLQQRVTDQLFQLRSRFPSLRPAYDGTVVHVPIDDSTSELAVYLGRDHFARLIDNLARAGVAAQFLDVIFAGPQSADEDRLLAEALADAGNAYLGMALGLTAGRATADAQTLAPAERQTLEGQRWRGVPVHGGDELLHPSRYFLTHAPFAAGASGLGFIDALPDRDGVFRRVALVARDGDALLPSLTLRVVCRYLAVDPGRIELFPGSHLLLRDARRPGQAGAADVFIPIDESGRMLVNFLGPWGTMKVYPFTVVYEASDDRFMLEDLREELLGKIAVVSWFSTGMADLGPVPTDPAFPRAGIWADAINTILGGEFLREWSGWRMLVGVELPLLVLLFFAATRLGTLRFVFSAVGLLLLYLVVTALAFMLGNLILDVAVPVMTLVGATVSVTVYQFHVESRARARLDRELAVAREIQLGTLPGQMPRVEGYDVDGASVPADETGGDSFDVFPLGDGRLMLLLGDATGHGIGPALSVTQVRAMLRIAARLGANLDAILTHINDQLSDDLAANRFVTAFLGVVDPAAHQIVYHSAGQGPLLHFHARTGECEWLGSSTMALGMLPGLPIKAPQRAALEPGDIWGLMTDGVFEQENESEVQFGMDRVAELFRAHHRGPMKELVQAIYGALKGFQGNAPQADDVTVLLVRRLSDRHSPG